MRPLLRSPWKGGESMKAEKLRKAKVVDQQVARAHGESRRMDGDGRHTFRASLTAVMNAVATEGREVMMEEGNGYWEDMKRRYPWTNPSPDHGQPSLSARHNRHGRLSRRIIYSNRGKCENVYH